MSSKKKDRQKSSSSQDEGAELFDRPIKDTNNDGEAFWSLGNKKRVTISQFKGKTYVNIREYYEKDGELLPTKKGISLGVDQWEQVKKVIGDIDKELLEVSGIKGSKRVKKEKE